MGYIAAVVSGFLAGIGVGLAAIYVMLRENGATDAS